MRVPSALRHNGKPRCLVEVQAHANRYPQQTFDAPRDFDAKPQARDVGLVDGVDRYCGLRGLEFASRGAGLPLTGHAVTARALPGPLDETRAVPTVPCANARV